MKTSYLTTVDVTQLSLQLAHTSNNEQRVQVAVQEKNRDIDPMLA